MPCTGFTIALIQVDQPLAFTKFTLLNLLNRTDWIISTQVCNHHGVILVQNVSRLRRCPVMSSTGFSSSFIQVDDTYLNQAYKEGIKNFLQSQLVPPNRSSPPLLICQLLRCQLGLEFHWHVQLRDRPHPHSGISLTNELLVWQLRFAI